MKSICKRGGGRQRGFTLIELMVTIAVLAILAGIGYPLYSDQLTKARRNDARNALRMVAMAQERFYTVNGRYACLTEETDVKTMLEDLNLPQMVDPDNVGQGLSPRENYAITFDDVDCGTYLVTATAQGKQAENDADCAVFTLDQVGIKTATNGNDVSCW